MWRYLIGTVFTTASILLAATSYAQSTGGVFPPNVNEGHRSWQYRAAFNPDTDAFAQRFHYQQSLNGDYMLRGLVQTRKTTDKNVDVDFVQAELFWDLNEDASSWRTGIRIDARLRTEGRPGLLGLNWINRWKLSDNTEARFVVLSSIDIGDGARDGVFLQTRGAYNYRTASGVGIGAELFSSYGSTDNFASVDEQRHQLGPTLNIKLSDSVSLFGGPLFGLTDASPDSDWRIWVAKTL